MTNRSLKYPLSASFTGTVNRRPLVLAISSLLLGGALVGPVQALAFPAVVKLADLDGDSGFRLDGEATGDSSGFSVSVAGDINGDGIDDLIIGARTASPEGNGSAGSSYVVFGRDSGFPATLNLSSLNGSTGFRIDGAVASDFSGSSVSAVGDINGDGIDDLIIGAYRASPQGVSDAGSSYVVFGRDVSVVGDFPVSLNLSSLNGSNGFRLDGAAAMDRSGESVSAAGDINGDGIADLIIGARAANPDGNVDAGSSYVVFGRDVSVVGDFQPVLNLSSLNGFLGFRLDGVSASDNSGHSVSAAGDINGDGLDDLIVGASGAAPGGNPGAGSSYVVFGRNVSAVGQFPAILNLSSLDGSTGFRLDGVAGSISGHSVSSAGDINDDGIDDLIVGARGADPGGNSFAGSSYVVFGRDVSVAGDFPATLALSTLDGSTGFRLDGVAQGDYSGFSVSEGGDINGDGIDDLIIGAFLADPDGNSNAGSSYVVFGRNTGFPASVALAGLNGSTGFRLDGVAVDDRTGLSVSTAGDINGDGIDDLIVGAPFISSSYVVFGRGDSLFMDRFATE